jgi:hypothetical protein
MPNNNRPYWFESKGVVESKGQRKIWDRLDGESTAAYAAFCAYRDMGTDRSLVKVSQKVGKNRTLMERWSCSWNWQNRVWEFDAAEDERSREQLVRDRLAMRKRQIVLGQALQSVASYGLREWQQKIERGEALNMTPHEICSLMELGAELEAHAMGDEKDHRYTRIVVNFGTHEYDDELKPLLEAENEKKKPN